MTLQPLLAWDCLYCQGPLLTRFERLACLCLRCQAAVPLMLEPFCGSCGISLSSEDGLCLQCREGQGPIPGVAILRSACLYVGAGQDLMQLYKADGGQALAWVWARILNCHLRRLWTPDLAIVPVPPKPANVRRRGFDPLALMLRRLPEIYRPAIHWHLLERANSKSQKELDRAERLHNLDGKIRVRPNQLVPSKILLIDDVCTTGATLSACALALRNAGSQNLNALTLFRD